MKRVLLTGGTGFVGANLAERLVADGHEVHLLLREGFQDWRIENLLPHMHVHLTGLDDKVALVSEVAKIRPEWVFHLAAFGAYSWQDDLAQAVNTNYLGTMNLLDACLKTGFEIFVNTGSSSEYGFKDHAPSEDESLEPNSFYAATKAGATLFCRYAARRFNRPIFTMRLYSVYGAYEEPHRFIPALVLNGLEGRFPPLANPDTARDFIFAGDVVEAYLWAAASAASLPPGEVFNVGTGKQTSLREVVRIAMEIFDIGAEPVWGSMNDRLWDTNIWVADVQKLRAHGWEAQYDLRRGLETTAGWFRQNPLLVDRVYRLNQ